MTAYTKGNYVRLAQLFKRDVSELLTYINDQLDRVEFVVRPLHGQPSDGVPYGFYTIGFARFNLPEIYVSGVAINDFNYNLLFPHIQALHSWLSQNGYGSKTSQEVAMAMNRELANTEIGQFFQARPVDAERMVYGQAQMLRYWLEEQQCLDNAKAIQIVWRNPGDVEFPIVSSKNQLLLDYVPFGTPIPKPILVGDLNAAA